MIAESPHQPRQQHAQQQTQQQQAASAQAASLSLLAIPTKATRWVLV
jgi:hypothetical protein